MGDIGFGAFGFEVAGIQQLLADTGHYTGAVDGVHGPVTRQAIRSWQRRIGVPGHGQWDEQTNRTTFERLSAFNPDPTVDRRPITPPGRTHG